ncbi:MAG: hypothetical protein JW888_04040 [Pirellulales bacterium]|nr:hypothetical protein [Pirellulales bacterium]
MSMVCGFIAAFVVLALLFKPLFGDAEGFGECLRFWITPDIFSMVRGEWGEDLLAEIKLGVWLFCGGAAGYAVHAGIASLLG